MDLNEFVINLWYNINRMNIKNKILEILDSMVIIDSDWKCSSLSKFRLMIPKRKGAFGEKVYKAVLEEEKITYSPSVSTDHDVIVNGEKIEVKMASCSKKDKKGNYTLAFNQIRPRQDYDKLVFITFHPNHIEIREISKDKFMLYVKTHSKNIIWVGGKEKKISCNYDISKSDIFQFIIRNDQWGKDFELFKRIDGFELNNNKVDQK